jgi:hypothetical protein
MTNGRMRAGHCPANSGRVLTFNVRVSIYAAGGVSLMNPEVLPRYSSDNVIVVDLEF